PLADQGPLQAHEGRPHRLELPLRDRHPTVVEQTRRLGRKPPLGNLRRRHRAGDLPDPAGPLLDRDEADEPMVVPARLAVGGRPQPRAARSGQPARHPVDGPLPARRRHSRDPRRGVHRLFGLARVHPHAHSGRGDRLRPRLGRDACLHRRRVSWERIAPRLEGGIVGGGPLTPGHEEGLWEAAGDPRVWRWMPVNAIQSRGTFAAWFAEALERTSAGIEQAFAVLDAHSGQPLGSTRYLALRPEHRGLEIGWTWISATAWSRGANAEAKLMLMRHAFEELGRAS